MGILTVGFADASMDDAVSLVHVNIFHAKVSPLAKKLE